MTLIDPAQLARMTIAMKAAAAALEVAGAACARSVDAVGKVLLEWDEAPVRPNSTPTKPPEG